MKLDSGVGFSYGCAALAVLLTEFPLRGLRLPRSVLAETSRSFHTRMGRRVVVIGLIVGAVVLSVIHVLPFGRKSAGH